MESKARIASIVIAAYFVGYIVGQRWKACPGCPPVSICKDRDPCPVPVCTPCANDEHGHRVGVVNSPKSSLVCGTLIGSLREKGAYIHNSLVINDTTGLVAQGRGIVATVAINPATVLFSIPDALALVSRSVWTRVGLPTGVVLEPNSLRTTYLRDDETASVIKAIASP